MNRYPLWKYLLIFAGIAVGVVYALPNLYGEDPALQVSSRVEMVDGEDLERVKSVLDDSGIAYKSVAIEGDQVLARFPDTETQLRAVEPVREALSNEYVTALNLAPATPDWLSALNAAPMYLGLDLRGGVHFLLEVDMNAALDQAYERYTDEMRTFMREEKIRYVAVSREEGDGLLIRFRDQQARDQAREALGRQFDALNVEDAEGDRGAFLQARLTEEAARTEKKSALEQNITTLRNRVNELGVAEPVIQRQGDERIVVQLPGVQDTARAKEILGATATLEFRLVHGSRTDWLEADRSGQVPVEARLYQQRSGEPVLLKRRVIITGDQITDAASGIEQQSGSPAVFVTLNGEGARKMSDITGRNIGKPMAVVFIENKVETVERDGERVEITREVEEVINIATIRDQLSNRFQISGLDSTREARDLALLLRAGALKAPIQIVEERTVGPSLGQQNINQGFMSVVVGFLLVLMFMAGYYRNFGLFANAALAMNLVLIVAVLSMLQATLTLPGIAGIVLTVGMAVDANVLIFERIREELRNGNSPHASIQTGYGKAVATIADANITTLIAAVVLFSFGTGPIKGFAVTLSIGILTSMFTAILLTRALANLTYGRQPRIKRLSIGGMK